MHTTRKIVAALFMLMVASCSQKEKDDEISRLKTELQSAQAELTQTKSQLSQTKNELGAMKAAAEAERTRKEADEALRQAIAHLKLSNPTCTCSPTKVQVRCHIRSDAKVPVKVSVKGGGSAKIGDDWPWLESQSSITLQPNFETDMDITADIKSGACVEVSNCKCDIGDVSIVRS